MENKDKFTQNYEQRKQYFLMPVREMKQFVADTFEVRHNVITDVYEFRRKETGEGQSHQALAALRLRLGLSPCAPVA